MKFFDSINKILFYVHFYVMFTIDEHYKIMNKGIENG